MEGRGEGDSSLNSSDSLSIPESPRPTAFTIDFGEEKKVDTQRQKILAEKFQKRHKRGKSLSKIEDCSPSSSAGSSRKHPLSGNLPRKSSFQSEGYFSSDEKPDRSKSTKVNTTKRSDLTLFLKKDRMTQSFPNGALPSIISPEGLQNISSPEFDLISPFSPSIPDELAQPIQNISLSSEEQEEEMFIKGTDFDFDKKSDTVSEAGTYTLEVDNYSEEQKARMSIDRDFQIEHVSVQKKTEAYLHSVAAAKVFFDDSISPVPPLGVSSPIRKAAPRDFVEEVVSAAPPLSTYCNRVKSSAPPQPSKVLSPILSPTENLSIVYATKSPNNDEALLNETFTKTLYSNPKTQRKPGDEGAVISVTSSGAFRSKKEEKRRLERKPSLTKSEVHVEAYIDGKGCGYEVERLNNGAKANSKRTSNLTANIVNVQSIEVTPNASGVSGGVVSASLVFGKMGNVATVTTGLPPSSPTKIPSPIQTLSRPRSRNNLSAGAGDDLDTEVFLKPTQNYINSLQKKLSLEGDRDGDGYAVQLNNTAHLLKQKASHIRHNSLDDKAINNKLEHFQTKNIIDQTYTNYLNQYRQNKVVNKINNSPSDSPVRRSSSFSNRHQINNVKTSNLSQKETNLCQSPSNGIQRSSSTASIKHNLLTNRRSSISEHKKIDRSQFGDTESSSEEDLDRNLQKRKDIGSVSNTRCNRTFSLRRARLDAEAAQPKCPNTPEMRRKSFQPSDYKERAISVDRRPVKTNEVQSRYLMNITKKSSSSPSPKEISRPQQRPMSATKTPSKMTFSRTDSGRFSMRAPKPPTTPSAAPRSGKKENKVSKQNGGRSNSSLSSREVEFQNWKRRKSYDPMKAAAEGKRKEMQKRLTTGMTGSYTEASGRTGAVSPDSSPSHSGSVHRSQVSPYLINMVPGDYSDC